MLRYHHNQWWAEDIHSTNGTFINREKIMDPTVLFSEDVLRCGVKEWKIMIESQEKTR
jgi:pSer/pThr/pTyr-binding forkhead associated (FHA) protein